MNWYKKAKIDKESGLVKSFLGLTIPFIAILLGMSYFDIESKIQNNPEQLTQQIQQAQETQKDQQELPENIINEPMSVENMKTYFKDEYQIILNAAKRNNLDPNDYDLLFAIRKSEAGGRGREFGIIHPKCDTEMKKRPNETLDIQAGWAAATIVKNRARWEKAGKPGDFITYLGNIYAPKNVANDPHNLNKNWIKNVTEWEQKI